MKNLIKISSTFILIFMAISNNSCIYNNEVILKNDRFEIRFDSKMYCKIFYNNLSINTIDPEDSFPLYFIKINDSVIKEFNLIKDSTNLENIVTEFGSGRRLTMCGIGKTMNGSGIKKKLNIELYEKYPTAVICYAEYQNLSDNMIELTESYSNYLSLDASLVKEKGFHAFSGIAGRPSPQIYTEIPDKLDRENYIGRSEKFEKVKKGYGGIPVTDVWCKKTGIGIGHIEPEWQNLYMPLKTDEYKRVVISILEKPGLNFKEPLQLKSGQEFKTIRSFVNMHDVDFYSTARIYGQLMQDQNINFQTNYTESDYAVPWCSWNDFATTGMASKYDVMIKNAVLDRVRELNPKYFQQIIFDAGWFNNQGDWMPNTDPRSFPGGEKDLIATIKYIHDKGFKVMLWVSFLTADPWSELSDKHPDWMITKPDGEFHYDRWSGYTMCPSLPEVQKYHQMLATRFIRNYKADAVKVDGMYTCPPCYNPKHNHKDPNESSRDFYKVFKSFYEEAKKINSEATIMVCPCGTINSYAILPYLSQTIGADPEKILTVRQMSKLYKALKGNNSPFSSDDTNYAEDELLRLPAAVGVGAIPQFLYGIRPNEERENFYNYWLKIYHEEQLFRADYVNLYDMYYDKPETYVFKKISGDKEIIYYSFFADTSSFAGKIELRGLKRELTYNVIDYPNNKVLGNISGKNPELNTSFENYLFIKCIPE